MTDPHDPLADALRDALRAEAADAQAGTELLARIRAQAAAPAPRRRNPLLLAAAASVVIAAIATGLALANSGSDESLDVVGDPDAPAPSIAEDVPTVCTTNPIGSPPCGHADEHPSLLVYVREDGWLVAMDLYSGDQHELLTMGDPREEGDEIGPTYIDGLDLSPDGEWIFFSTCCEPASGLTYRVPVTGGEPQPVAAGYDPRVSPDGRLVATSNMGIAIFATDPGRTDGLHGPQLADAVGDAQPHDLAWSPDGRRLAYIDGDHGQPGTMRTLLWDGTDLGPDPAGSAQAGASFTGWTREGMPVASAGEPIEDDRVMTQDATYRWQLRVDEAGQATYRDGFQSGDEQPINGLPPLLLADW